MTIFSRRFFHLIGFYKNSYSNLMDLGIRSRNSIQENLFVDISTYSDSPHSILNLNRRVGILFSVVFSMILARFLNGLMVFQDEEIQTLNLIQEIMAFGFLFCSLLVLVFISFLAQVNNLLNGIQLFKKAIYNSGILCILSGILFTLICISKYLCLKYFPNAFEFYVQLGPITLYVLQGSYYFALTFCIWMFFNRIWTIKTYLRWYPHSRN